MHDYFSIAGLLSILQETNSWNILIFILAEVVFWAIFSAFLTIFLPRKYRSHKKEIFLFFLIMNVSLLFMGTFVTIIMILFGLSMATTKSSKPEYAIVDLEDYSSSFPIIYNKFHEGVLAISANHKEKISSEEKIKSLKILYDSNAQGNIGKIKQFLADSSDETRLYAFALVSAAEKKLNTQIKELTDKIAKTKDKSKIEEYQFNLAQTYWQFIFHGVANEHMVLFYTDKIERVLKDTSHRANSYILLGKIHLFNKKYFKAEKAFLKAIELGANRNSVDTFLAEVKYEQGAYSDVPKYMQNEDFAIDLRMKPIYEVWRREVNNQKQKEKSS